ncbi:MAG TPA: AAA family ATPase [Archangium sp.]|nr:AAA family ATPase [Archangium sp.]
MLKSLQLKFGETPNQQPLTIPIGSAVVLVGPNNSGKSRLLQELEHFLTRGPHKSVEYLLLKDIDAEAPRSSSLHQALVSRIKEDLPKAVFTNPGEPIDLESALKEFSLEDYSKAMDLFNKGTLALTPQQKLLVEKVKKSFSNSFSSFGTFFQPSVTLAKLKEVEKELADKEKELADKAESHREEVQQAIRDLTSAGIALLNDLRKNTHENSAETAILNVVKDGRISVKPYLDLLASKTVRLDGRQRLEHVRPTALPTRDSRGNNPLTRLLKDSEARQLLREIVHEAFGCYLALDVSDFDKTRIKLSAESPEEHELRPLEPAAMEYFSHAQDIEEFSDGVKSFVGLLSAVLSDEYLVMLIDEPEAFLHPPLAKRLGHKLHQLSRSRGAHILAATHSADFLRGCIQAAPDVNIVRLTYRGGVPTARLLPVEELQRMMQDPLLRSTGTLSALFHEGAVVCEGDSDRAFYQEINERLIASSEGADGCLFMNAHSKQAIRRVVGLLRRMGIPAAAIVDLDMLSDESTLKDLLTAIGTDAATINTLGMTKGQFYRLFVDAAQGDKEKGKSLLKSKGLDALSENQRQSMMNLFLSPLAQLGIFVVPGGELESWLSTLIPEGVRPSKKEWLNTIFEALGADPNHNYVSPKDGDVWDFMRRIADWMGDPNRQGMPSP